MMPQTAFNRRSALLKDELRLRSLDSFLVTKDVNVSYLSGFSGHDAVMVVTPRKSFLIADSRYIEDARDSVKGLEVRLVRRSSYESIREIVSDYRLKRIGFESMDLPYEAANRLKRFVSGASLLPVKDLVEETRSVKDADEITSIKRSIRLTKKILEDVLALIRPGMSEESIAKKLEIAFLERGAKPGFELIVAADANSSKPHACPTAKKILKNSFVMIDVGCSFKEYNSDMTRMVLMGRVSERIRKIYEIVRAAQVKAIDMIAPGVEIAKIDAAARECIQDEGFGKYFGHALGHGVGMEVHEKPTVSGVSEGVLKSGMVFTVEPAIYIPKFGGIRLEDMVLVTDKGCEVLTI